MTGRFVSVLLLILLYVVNSAYVYAWSTEKISQREFVPARTLDPETSRRLFLVTAASAFSVTLDPSSAQAATGKVEEALEEMRVSKEKLQAIPELLEEKEWDKVRTILKLPPVNKLWNLGDVRPYLTFDVVSMKLQYDLTISSSLSKVTKYCVAIGKRNRQYRLV